MNYEPYPDIDTGFENLYFKIFDGEVLSDEEFNLVLTILPVNDAPVLDDISPQNTNEDIALIFDLTSIDVDEDPLTYSASVDGDGSASIDGTTIKTSTIPKPRP